MKKRWLSIWLPFAVLLLIVGTIDRPVFTYPELPFQPADKQEVIFKFKQQKEQLVRLGEEEEYTWYGTGDEQGNANERLKTEMHERGWSFQEQMGAGYLFHKADEKIVIRKNGRESLCCSKCLGP